MQNHTGELTRTLDRRGVRQTVLTAVRPGAPRHQWIGENAELIRLGLPIQPLRQIYSMPAIWTVLRRGSGASIVHVHVGEDLAVIPLGMLAAGAHGLRLVMTVHCSMRDTVRITDLRSAVLRIAGGAIETYGERAADAVIVLTRRAADGLQRAGVDKDRIKVLPPGVNRSLFRGPFEDPVADIGRPRILFIGRLHRSKSVHTLIDAVARLNRSDAHLVLVGNGPERHSLEKRIEATGLRRRAHITGFVPHDDIPAYLAHADVLVLPSAYEELGSVLIEALQLGVPLVASRTGGIPEVVKEGENGLLVPPGDVAGFRDAIDAVLSNATLTASLRKGALEHAGRYDWNVLAGEVLSIYESVLEAPRRAAARARTDSGTTRRREVPQQAE